MPEHTLVVACGFDPILVRGYVRTGARGLWWYLPEELYHDYKLKPGSKAKGRLIAIYDHEGKKIAEPNEPFEWNCSRETGMAVNLPPEVITKYKLTAWHFLELMVEKVIVDEKEIEVYPGETIKRKWWPADKMKLEFWLGYIE